jgi:hypothetical protein
VQELYLHPNQNSRNNQFIVPPEKTVCSIVQSVVYSNGVNLNGLSSLAIVAILWRVEANEVDGNIADNIKLTVFLELKVPWNHLE